MTEPIQPQLDDDAPLADLLRGRQGGRPGEEPPQGEQVDIRVRGNPEQQQHIRVEAAVGGAAAAAATREEVDDREQFHDARPPPGPDHAMLNDFGRAMTDAIQNAVRRVQPNREVIPVPVFDGEGDVELFVQYVLSLCIYNLN